MNGDEEEGMVRRMSAGGNGGRFRRELSPALGFPRCQQLMLPSQHSGPLGVPLFTRRAVGLRNHELVPQTRLAHFTTLPLVTFGKNHHGFYIGLWVKRP